MAKKVKCPNPSCKEKTKITISPDLKMQEGENIYCGTCGTVMPVTEE